METRKKRHAKRRIEGVYPIDTGTARIVADPLRDGAFTLEVNNVPSSYVVPGAPEVLEYDYMRWIAELVRSHRAAHPDARSPTGREFTAVHLGAAGCALPSYFAHRFGNMNTAVELDRGLATLVREVFDPPVDIVVAEARAFTHAVAPHSVDVIVRDVFAGPSTPRALTTVEFYRAAHAALRPGGIFLANVGDRVGLPESTAELAGLREVFAHVGAVSTPDMLGGRAYGNIVLAASDAPLDHALHADFTEASAPAAQFRGAQWAPGGRARRD